MARPALEPRQTYRSQLHDLAQETYGYITTGMAAELGIPAAVVVKLAARGRLASTPALVQIAWGLYRFDDIPISPRDEYMEAVLRVGPEAFLIDETVLALHELALVAPRRIRVGTPRRVRSALPATIEVVHANLPPEDLTRYDGIPATTVARALIDCRATVMQDRLLEAAIKAEQEGLLLRRDTPRILAELRKPL